jgi:hypothetical protein
MKRFACTGRYDQLVRVIFDPVLPFEFPADSGTKFRYPVVGGVPGLSFLYRLNRCILDVLRGIEVRLPEAKVDRTRPGCFKDFPDAGDLDPSHPF